MTPAVGRGFGKSYCSGVTWLSQKIWEFLKNRRNPSARRRCVVWSVGLGLLGPSREYPDTLRKNSGVSKLTGAIFSAEFLKNSIFWEISQKSTYSRYHSCEDRWVPATLRPVPVYHWMCVVRGAAGFYARRLHGGIRGHYPGTLSQK